MENNLLTYDDLETLIRFVYEKKAAYSSSETYMHAYLGELISKLERMKE